MRLFVVIQYCPGFVLVSGNHLPLCDPLHVGEILTLEKEFKSVTGNTVFQFSEKRKVIHPTLNTECGYKTKWVRELTELEDLQLADLLKDPSKIS